jgi:hypothetical protein
MMNNHLAAVAKPITAATNEAITRMSRVANNRSSGCPDARLASSRSAETASPFALVKPGIRGERP